MRYYSARKREDDQRWDYTVQYSWAGQPYIDAVGYCRGTFEQLWPELTAEEFEQTKHSLHLNYEQYQDWRNERLPVAHKYHSDGHALPGDACDCYREYLLDTALNLDLSGKSNTLHQCEAMDCTEWTNRAVMYDHYYHFWLCDTHRTRDTVAMLAPEVGERWSS